jgi:hypothetical protein
MECLWREIPIDRVARNRVDDAEAILVDYVPYHKEVQGSLVFLSRLVGVSRILVQRDISGRERDGEASMYNMYAGWRFVWPTQAIEAVHSCKSKLIMLFLVTPEIRSDRFSALLSAVGNSHCDIKGFYVCHNPDTCIEQFRKIPTRARSKFIIVATTPQMRRYLLSIYAEQSILWVPLLQWPSYSCNDKALRPNILVPGMVNFSKRPYHHVVSPAVLESSSPSHAMAPKVALDVFGECQTLTECDRLRSLSRQVARTITIKHGLNFSAGRLTFAQLEKHLATAKFVASIVDESAPFVGDYLTRGKLTSSIALGLSHGLPVIGWCDLARSYGIESTICFESGNDIPAVLRASFGMSAGMYCDEVNKLSSVAQKFIMDGLSDVVSYLSCESENSCKV